MNKVPLFDRLIVERFVTEEKTKGGIILSMDSQEVMRPWEGNVIKVGGDVKLLKEGDVISFSQYAGQTMEVDGKKYIIMREEEALTKNE